MMPRTRSGSGFALWALFVGNRTLSTEAGTGDESLHRFIALA
jgi:hypothetical protein